MRLPHEFTGSMMPTHTCPLRVDIGEVLHRSALSRHKEIGSRASRLPDRLAFVTEQDTQLLRPVTVIRDHKVRAVGRRLDDVIVYDWGFELNDRSYEQRSYVLLDDGFQINQPVIFSETQRGWWYCDLVRVTDNGDEVLVEDLWIDVIVGPPDHPYRVLDLDEYATAAAHGDLSTAEAADGLVRTQRFLDRRLNRRHEVLRSWPDFPPKTVTALANVTFEKVWSHLSPGEA